MSYTYNADGVKLKSVPLQFGGPAMNPFGLTGPTGAQPQGNPIPGGDGEGMPGELTLDTSTLYCGNVIFERGELSKLLTDEGYVTFTNDSTPVYHYYLRDHLGNVRVVFTGGFLGDIEQRNDYYPSGALMATSTGGSVQPYKYNGKELERTGGLDWYDYGARHMDGALGRFTTMAPMCEKYYGISPYAYCANNPVNLVDPDGRDWYQTNNGDIYWSEDVTSEDNTPNECTYLGKEYQGISIYQYETNTENKINGIRRGVKIEIKAYNTSVSDRWIQNTKIYYPDEDYFRDQEVDKDPEQIALFYYNEKEEKDYHEDGVYTYSDMPGRDENSNCIWQAELSLVSQDKGRYYPRLTLTYGFQNINKQTTKELIKIVNPSPFQQQVIKSLNSSR